MPDISEQFYSSDRDIFRCRRGPAHDGGDAPCRWKLCITATDEQYLVELLYKITQRDDCFFVKYSPSGSPKCRDGMFLGRVFLTSEEKIGELWRELRTDSKLMCSIQDDIAIESYRSRSA
jgi:hypothetical protein